MRLLMPRNAAAEHLAATPPPLADPTAAGGMQACMPSEGANWIYSVTYGGGLVSGDNVSVDGHVGVYVSLPRIAHVLCPLVAPLGSFISCDGTTTVATALAGAS